MEPIKCFMVEPTGEMQRHLRRFVYSAPEDKHYHSALAPDGVARRKSPYTGITRAATAHERKRKGWPKKCECGYRFKSGDQWQIFFERIYVRADTGEKLIWKEAPAGAILEATRYHKYPEWCGPDGRALLCKLPNGHDWHIDGRANNCTMKEDDVHKCWVRHGEPPNLTVDKNGHTCQAGAGSIQSGNWHGYLRNGHLVTG